MFWFNKNNQFICEFVYTGCAECFTFNKKEGEKIRLQMVLKGQSNFALT